MLLGKRKRDVAVVRMPQRGSTKTVETEVHVEEPNDMFRNYFESRFEPLPGSSKNAVPSLMESESQDDVVQNENEDDNEISESGWEGLSDIESPPSTTRVVEVQVVEHSTRASESVEDGLRGIHYKAFMTSRPPQEVSDTSKKTKPKDEDEADNAAETLNLKHDLDLQRLLKESHLLERAKTSSSAPGSHRHKATELRMQALGSKTSTLLQEKMPLSHKRGIAAKAATKDTLRRTDAKESGIILERASKSTTKAAPSRRERGVDVPAVGKFRGGTLRLDKKDIAAIQGPGQRSGRTKKVRI